MIAAQRSPRVWNRLFIARALRGKCERGAWIVRPAHRSAKFPPTRSVHPTQLHRGPCSTLGVFHTLVIPRTPAHFAAHAKCGSRLPWPAKSETHELTVWPMQFAIYEIYNSSKLRPIQSTIITILRPNFRIRTSSITY